MTDLSEKSNLLSYSQSPEKFYRNLGNLTKDVLAPRICNGGDKNLDKWWKKIAFKQERAFLVSPLEDMCLEFAQEAWCCSKKLTMMCVHGAAKVLC